MLVAASKNSGMERFRQLVLELNQQVQAGASPERLRQTVALLSLELDRETGQSARSLGTAKVAVVLPQTPVHIDLTSEPQARISDPVPASVEDSSVKSIPKVMPLVLFDEEFTVEQIEPPLHLSNERTRTEAFDVMEEVPTLYMHRHAEVNEKLLTPISSLNDQLKPPDGERHDTLQTGPITDLRKAIGVNERFQFIRELFRNDEAMYERSIKTINHFQIFPEADFWINRELKTKLGWTNDHPLVKQFDQLIRRRFS